MKNIAMSKNIRVKRMPSDVVFDTVVYAIVFLIAILILYPLYFVVIASISNPELVSSGQVLFLPKDISLDGFMYIFRDKRIGVGYYNTVRYTTFGTMLALVLTIPSGYALSRKDMLGRNVIMKLVMFTRFFAGGLIPTYLVVKSLGLVDTPFVLMILGSFSVFNLILTRTFFVNTLPVELQEAADVDGCSIGRFFVSIALPLSKPIIAIMVLYYAVGHWNSFFNALIYVNNNKLYPLQLILRDILILGQSVSADISDPDMLQEMYRISQTIKYGVIIVSSLPVLMLYPFVQKHFVSGIMVGSVKG